MKISAKIDYACRALMELSLHWPRKEPMQILTIAKHQNIPIKFLTQIMLTLKQFGYVQSVRGKTGGYLLIRNPKDIHLSKVLQDMGSLECVVTENRATDKKQHVMHCIWKEIDEAVLNTVEKINFENICNRHQSSENIMTYDI